MQCFANPGRVGAVFEPTNILLRDVWMRSFDEFLEVEIQRLGSPQPEYTFMVLGARRCCYAGLLRRGIGFVVKLGFVLADEIDTSPHETSKKAVEMFRARYVAERNLNLRWQARLKVTR